MRSSVFCYRRNRLCTLVWGLYLYLANRVVKFVGGERGDPPYS